MKQEHHDKAKGQAHGEHDDRGHGQHGHDHDHKQKTVNIVVNGEAKEWHKHKISYDEVVKLAFPDGPTGGNIRYSVAWTKPDGQEGSLRPGHSAGVAEGMTFDVRNTDKS